MSKKVPMIGRRFDRLTVTSAAPKPLGPPLPLRWNCLCDCGNSVTVRGLDVRAGKIGSCGCKRRDSKPGFIHGKAGSSEHKIWWGMIARCENPNIKSYSAYGGAGISVCARWRIGDDGVHGFICFLSDLGPRPSVKHSLERDNPTKDYEPGNVRWALPLEQANNKRATRWVTYRGEKMSLCNAVRAAGSVIHHEAAAVRIKTGWSVERAVETPSSKSRTRADRALVNIQA